MQEHLDPNNYRAPYPGEGVERFDSLKDARDSFWRTVDSERIADETQHTAWIFFYDPCGEDVQGDAYPDRIFTVGPRGGIRTEHA
jgi:hypothetical protein